MENKKSMENEKNLLRFKLKDKNEDLITIVCVGDDKKNFTLYNKETTDGLEEYKKLYNFIMEKINSEKIDGVVLIDNEGDVSTSKRIVNLFFTELNKDILIISNKWSVLIENQIIEKEEDIK